MFNGLTASKANRLPNLMFSKFLGGFILPDTPGIFSPSNALSVGMTVFYPDLDGMFSVPAVFSSPPHLVSVLSRPRQATGLPYSEIT